MTLTYGFYDSVASDRLYNALQMSSIFDGIIEDGVFATIGDSLMVFEDSGMDVEVGTGRAWFDHTWTYNDAEVSVTVPTADALLPRIDVVYLEINQTTRINSVDILEGTPASSPSAPTLTNTATVHQYPLAHILVEAGVTAIDQGDITNKVGLEDCPFVTGPLTVIATEDLVIQWQAQWDDWFEAIQDQLSEEAETNLQAQIWAIVGDTDPPLIDLVELKSHDHTGGEGDPIPAAGLASGAVTEAKIGTGAVTYTKLATNAVTSVKINAGAVTEGKIGSLAVSNAKIANGAVNADKLATDAVTNSKVANNAIDTAQIADEAVTAAKIDNRTRSIYIPATEMYELGTIGKDIEAWGVTYDFPYNDNTPALMSSIAIPDDLVGTTIMASVVWMCSLSGNVRWTVDYLDVGDGNSISNDESQSQTIASPVSSTLMSVDNVGNLNVTAGNVLSVRVGRNTAHGDDTVNGDAVFFGLLLTYTADS
jgi:hypothetical protein